MSTSFPLAGSSAGGTDRVSAGIAMVLAAVVTFGIQDTVAKILVQTYSPFQTTMVRYWGFALFSLLLVMRQAPLRQALRSSHPILQVLRGVLLVADIWLFARALQTVPLGELQAIVLVYPLMVTLVAIPVLGEKVGFFRVAAVLAGFSGALIIVRPGGVPLDWGALAGVLSAAAYALYAVLTRRVSRTDSTVVGMFYVALVGLVMTSAVGIFFWQPIEPGALIYFAVIAITTCIGHGLTMWALSLAPAGVLAPLSYFSLPWAMLLSLVVFGHWIDAISLVGAAVIVIAGLVVMGRERWLGRRAATDAAAPPEKE